MNKPSQSTTQSTERLSNLFAALGDVTRMKIIEELIACQQQCKDMCVGELATKTNVSSSAVSQHFRLLEMNGIVRPERMGQKICYRLREEDKIVKELLRFINKARRG